MQSKMPCSESTATCRETGPQGNRTFFAWIRSARRRRFAGVYIINCRTFVVLKFDVVIIDEPRHVARSTRPDYNINIS